MNAPQPKAADNHRPSGGIISYFTRHRTLANLLLVIMVVAGLAASTRIRAQYFPDVVNPSVTVSVKWEGAGAEDVDRGIVQLLDPVLMAVEGVSDTVSNASEGSARITVTFEPGYDLMRATEDVQAAVDSVRNLPDEAEEPVVRRSSWFDPVTDVVISGPLGLEQLGQYGDEFITRLFERGITRTTLRGMAGPEIMVEASSVDLMRYDVTLSQIAQTISAAVQSTPAGDIANGSSRLRTGEEARSPETIAALVLSQGADGSRLTIGDVARITLEPSDRATATYVGDYPAVTIRVNRNEAGDAIRMQAEIQDVAAQMLPLMPPGSDIALIRARADEISGRLVLLLDNAFTGLLLVMVLLFLFLNARTALWVAAGIPVALLAAVGVMYVAGLTLNMISLFALIITLAIVVDDAIVVGEHADYRSRVLREPPAIAAERAAKRMAMPVFAATITTVLAFAALFAIGGQFGSTIADIPFTVIAVLIASLVECFLILPNHMAHALAAAQKRSWFDWPSEQVNRGMAWLGEHVIRPFTRFVITVRYPALALMVFLLAGQIGNVMRGDLPFRFFAGPEQSSISGNFAMLSGAERADSLAMMRELQRAAQAVNDRFEAEHGRAPITFALAEVGNQSGRGLATAENKDADLLGGISIELIGPDDRPYSSAAFVAALQAEIQPHPRLEEFSFRGGRFGPGGDALSIQLEGNNSDTLKAAAEALKATLSQYPEISALEDSLAYDKDEMILRLTPQGEALGLSTASLASELRARLNGIEAATFADGPRSAAIRVELPDREKQADFLETTLLRTASGKYVPLADVVEISWKAGFSSIRRENGLRVVTVTADLSEDDPQRASEIQRLLNQTHLPQIEADFAVTSRQTGLAEQQAEFFGDAQLGVGLCLLGIYLALAWIFASWTRPFVVMLVIPFGIVGAFWGHSVWGIPLSLFSVVGLVGMSGIIINDSIILVAAYDDYCKTRARIPAMVEAVADRFRPVLLTTLTTVLGLLPLLYERSSQAEFLKPTVVTLVFGLGLGMVLVLVIVPAALMVGRDIDLRLKALKHLRRHLKRGKGQAPAVQAAKRLLTRLTVALAGWFSLTLLPVMGGFGLWPLWPQAWQAAPSLAGFLLFALGAVLIVGGMVWRARHAPKNEQAEG